MASLTESEVDALVPIVELQAKIVAQRYEGVEVEDLAQEVWVWIVEKSSPALKRYIADNQIGALQRSVYGAAVRWCETDKKRRLAEQGINWRDQYNYSRPEVSRLLPLALDTNTVPQLTGGEMRDTPSAKSDPAHGGDLLVGIIDVRNAYGKLSESDQQFIQIVVGLNCDWNDIAATTGVKASSAYAKWMRILDRMVTRHLGRKTGDEPAEPEDE